MTSAVSGALPEPHRVPPVYGWLRHHPWWSALVMFTLAQTALWLTSLWAGIILSMITFFILDFSLTAMAKHANRSAICARCALDHLPHIDRERWKLRLGHWLVEKPVTTLLGKPVEWLTRKFSEKWAARLFGILFVLPAWAVVVFATIPIGKHGIPIGMDLAIFVVALGGHLTIVHNRCAPWCPFCKGGGGEGSPLVDPTPDPVIEKVLT